MPFTKGDPNINKKGRPAGRVSLLDELKKTLHDQRGLGKTNLSEFIKTIWDKAIEEKDHPTQRLILNYLEGMPQQKTDITSGGRPIVLPSEVIDKYKLETDGTSPSTESDS